MEQDSPLDAGNDELPTYDDLAAQHGPNSRFGRWKSWVEKRAAERYAEDTPEKQEARRMRGWGPHVDTQTPEPPPPVPSQSQLRPPSSHLNRTQTVLSESSPDSDPELYSSTSYITLGEALPPSHLKLHSFGSRFLPHSQLPILTLLPLFDDTKLLIGHVNGLSVLDMKPAASSSELGSKEPRRRDIWHGEGVYQLALLEHEQRSTNGTPQGVILALVGAEPPEGGSEKESKEPHKSIRMYQLSSLASITSWATARHVHEPLDLPSHWQPQQTKKHKQQRSISRGLRSDASLRGALYPLDPDIPPPVPPKDPPRSKSSPSSPAPSPPKMKLESPHRGSAGSEWDVVGHDDLPMRWATDYVPLASPNSRLASQSVLFFELRRCADGGRVTARLAVATKQNIFLYESVRGERAFRLVKDFYTPIPARSARFVYQSQHEGISGSVSLSPLQSATYSGSRGYSASEMSSRRASSPSALTEWARSSFHRGQLSLFVVFEKKAGLIRVSDSCVGEIDLWQESGTSPKSAFRRSITSLEGLTTKGGTWAPPAEIALPLRDAMPYAETGRVYLLTRGKHTHIVGAPLRMPLASHAPLKVLTWGVSPTQVVPRACERPGTGEPFLQVTGLSEDGVEVQELRLGFLSAAVGKGKGRGREEGVVVVRAEVGPGGAGFLCMGGHWTEHGGGRTRGGGVRRHVSAGTVDTVDLLAKRAREEGFYAWTQKGYDDWRVFWLGGDSQDAVPPVSP